MTRNPPRMITDASGKRVPLDPRKVCVDHDSGLIYVPGKSPMPVVGPTTGQAYDSLKKSELQAEENKHGMLDALLHTWQCTQCRKRMPGSKILVARTESGFPIAPHCPDPKCGAPVVRVNRR